MKSVHTKLIPQICVLFPILIFGLSACHPNLNPTALSHNLKSQQRSDSLNSIPQEFDQPDRRHTTGTRRPTGTENVQSPTTTKEPSNLIKIAHEVMVKEGPALGTPCNYYLSRVLVRAGFKKGDFLANDFDVYAETHFASFRNEDFKVDSGRSDKDELKKYLWSYAERTPFILQWTRPRGNGHLAIVERVGEYLIIYQASMGKYTARRTQTTIENLFSSNQAQTMTVYSEFK